MPGSPAELAPDAGSSPRRVTAAVAGDPRTLSGKLNQGTGSVPGVNELELLVHAGTAVADDGGRLLPQLAEQVPSIQNGQWRLSANGAMETTWTLKHGVLWHDGTPLTADDLAFTMGVVQDREIGSNFRDSAYDSIETVAVQDARTIIVGWRRPYILADTLQKHGRVG